MAQVFCDGFKTEVKDSALAELMAIPITAYNSDYWNTNHSQSMGFDISFDNIECTVNWDEKEQEQMHQVDIFGVHHFSIHRNLWVEFIN
jgi:hypothetical protein